ncbi:MAG: response regulator transcription factor [Actinomycetota bacterium]
MPTQILIADDDPTITMLLKVNLELEGYEVAIATDGRQALDMASSRQPSLILLDIMMPNMDGWTAKEKLSQNKDTADIPVIFLSARAQLADIKKGYDLGAAEYITKPFDPAELISTISQVLDGDYRRAHEEEIT